MLSPSRPFTLHGRTTRLPELRPSRRNFPELLPIVAVAIVTLYFVKSRLGIDLMEGPSPLHGWLYPIVQALE